MPANNNYEDHEGKTLKSVFDSFGGMQPVIFALETQQNSVSIEDYRSWPDTILLDIDASYVTFSNQQSFRLPKFPRELDWLKTLNRIKNRKFANYDQVYFDRVD